MREKKTLEFATPEGAALLSYDPTRRVFSFEPHDSESEVLIDAVGIESRGMRLRSEREKADRAGVDIRADVSHERHVTVGDADGMFMTVPNSRHVAVVLFSDASEGFRTGEQVCVSAGLSCRGLRGVRTAGACSEIESVPFEAICGQP
jgi:hypothetical protein